MRYQVNYRFATNITYAGQNILIAGTPGEEMELDDSLADELAGQVPGALSLLIETPVEIEEPPVTVEMIEGATPKAKTRGLRKRPS